jgi:Bacterial Ig domain/Beta-propeller repeat
MEGLNVKRIVPGILGLVLLLASCGQDSQPDTTKPVVTLVSSKASVTAAESIKLTATATDNIGVTKVEFYDGATKLGEDSSSPYEFDVALTAIDTGLRSYFAKAFDAVKNEGRSIEVNVLVDIPDTLKPTVLLKASKTSVKTVEKIQLTTDVSDNVAVTKVEFFEGAIKLGEDLIAPFEIEIDLTDLNNGIKNYSAKAYDKADNMSDSEIISVFIKIPAIKQFGTVAYDDVHGIAIDSKKNVYITGRTSGIFSDKSAGVGGAFLSKYDSSGMLQWIRQFGTSGFDFTDDITIDLSDNIFISGATTGVFPENVKNGGLGDAFIIKFDSNGVQQWVKQFFQYGRGITSDSKGNIFIVGQTDDNKPFLIKYSINGVLVWSQLIESNASGGSSSVAVDSEDNVFVIGSTGGTFLGNISSGNYDTFLAKYDTNGMQKWVKQFGTSASDYGSDIAIDSGDNIFITGSTDGNFAENVNLGSFDAFLVKYDTNGMQQWVKQFGTNKSDSISSVAIDLNKNIFVTGSTNGAFPGEINLGDLDTFLMKYDLNGKQIFTTQFGTNNKDYSGSIAVDSDENIFIGGTTYGKFGGNANFGDVDGYFVRFSKIMAN